jgi:hypothetical protein
LTEVSFFIDKVMQRNIGFWTIGRDLILTKRGCKCHLWVSMENEWWKLGGYKLKGCCNDFAKLHQRLLRGIVRTMPLVRRHRQNNRLELEMDCLWRINS